MLSDEKMTKIKVEEICKNVLEGECARIESSMIVKFQEEIIVARDNINMILNGLGYKLSKEFKEKWADKK